LSQYKSEIGGEMSTLALLAFALWALFLRYIPNILNFLRLQRFAKTLPGPTIGELIANVKKGGEFVKKNLFKKSAFNSLEMVLCTFYHAYAALTLLLNFICINFAWLMVLLCAKNFSEECM